ncbi:MAG: aminofutalosine synthase MqnE [Phycisphaerae bacterium]|nr:aminofutalosine synthase MqnE [Phycisphaerae bacterium]HBZ96523.1 aminofutalosine synthase MqnE [Phycisphaerales bacterium]
MTTFSATDPAAQRVLGRVRDAALMPIAEDVIHGRRLDAQQGMTLFRTSDIWTVCSLADLVRRRLNGDVAYYNVNRHLNYSNICALSCKFCAFHRKRDQEGAYQYDLDDIRDEAIKAIEAGATEMHIVGGLHPRLPFDYYLDMLRTIRETAPRVHIKAFTAVEIVHLARMAKRGREKEEGIRWVIQQLKEAGLGSMPGGGAEVFDDRVHSETHRGKISGDQWLIVHRLAHEEGLNTNATMLYGHVETFEDRIRHMQLLRQEQDRTLLEWAHAQGACVQTAINHEGEEHQAVVLTDPATAAAKLQPTSETCSTGFYQTLIPLPFIPDDSELEHLPGPMGLENLRTMCVSRLMLDNFPHMKAFWIMQTLEMAQFMLQNGADDIDGTVVWYDITKVEGAGTHQEVTQLDLQRAAREAGFHPVERDTLYRTVHRDGREWSVDED